MESTQAKHPKTPNRISLVIPVRDEAPTIEKLFAAIAAQTRRPDEIVFVDGGSRDGTLELLMREASRDDRIRVIQTDRATPGRGRNIGIKAAANDWIALTDAGNRPASDWLEELERGIDGRSEADVVYGNYDPLTDSFFKECAAAAYAPAKVMQPTGPIRGPSIVSCLLKREAWRAVGGFPDLRAAEDLIFMEAIEHRGQKIVWAPRANVLWEIKPDLASTFRRFALYSRHNVWAGRQRFWHYGIARIYFVALLIATLAAFHSWWWLILIPVGFLARSFKSLSRSREGRSLLWVLNPARISLVMIILIAIDLATFLGWAQALATRPDGGPKP